MVLNFHSESFNFTSAVLDGVDPRTGLFNINMPLANLVGNDNLGPSLDLNLSYNPLSNSNSGFGKGFSISISNYNIREKLLTLSSGERCKVIDTNNQLIIRQKHLDTFRFEKFYDKNAYKITYKSGVTEILSGPQDAYDIKVPMEIYSPAGHKLTLKWEYMGSIPRLISIADQNTNLLQISYPGQESVWTTVKVWPDTQETYEMVFKFSNDNLRQIDNNALNQPLSWNFGYDRVDKDYYLIDKIKTPTGLVDQVYYKAGGMKFPDNARLPALPCVSRHVQYPGFGQPAIETLYEYSDHNYLGYGSTVEWKPDEDNLYGVLNGYEYYSREICKGEGTEVQTKRTYNNFHLLTREEMRQGNVSRTTETEYYARPAISFDDQPAQFQLPKKQTTTYRDTSKPVGKDSRSQETITEFDQSGNLIKKIIPDGTVTTLEYYNKAGEEGCPKDPYGFVRFLKKETIQPILHPSGFLFPTYTTHYTYESFGTRSNEWVKSVVLLTQQDLKRDEKPIWTKTTTYVNNPTSAEHGRISDIQTKQYDLDKPAQFYTSQEHFSFKIHGEVLYQEVAYTGHDGLKSSIKKEQSRYNGKLISETDSQGNKSSYLYDKLGRMTSRILNGGTEYENTITTVYSLIKNSQGDITEISTTQTDPKGNKKRTYFDGMGRTLKQARNDVDSSVVKTSDESFIDILKQDYDALGRKKKVTTSDYLRSEQISQTQISLTAELFYDTWGENHLIKFSDGNMEYSLYDPILIESISYTQSVDKENPIVQGKQKVKYNLQGLPVFITYYDEKDQEQGSIQQFYDGLGRLRHYTDELGQGTHYEYDALNRVVSQTLPDNTVITKAYAQHSGKTLITGIGVRDPQGQTYLLGEQSFDSLDRLTSGKNGGRKYLYQYKGNSPTPSKVTTPSGEILNYDYIPQLGNALKELKYKENSQRQLFTYDKLTGLCTEAQQSQGMARSMEYSPSGLIKREGFTPFGGQSQSTSYTYSLQGRLTSYVDVSGAHQKYGYDAFGRHILTDDPLVKVELKYDKLSRLIERMTTNKSTGACMKQAFTYDAFNREVKREITLNNDSVVLIESSYLLNDQLDHRITKRAKTVLRKEDFTYDARNRLTQYTCSGSELPEDSYGKAIQKQSFTYDALGNIKECVTEFESGSDKATFKYENPKDPTQLSAVSHSHVDYPKSIALQYDANGRLIQDEASRVLSYDPLGRLSDLEVKGTKRGTYVYDALDNLVGQKINENDERALYYFGDVLVNEIHHKAGKKEHIRLIKDGNATMAIYGNDTLKLTATDVMGSLLSAMSSQGSREDFRYAPYGNSSNRSSATSLAGFNGERIDPISGVYHLGNGYRAYNPALMRFNCPDSMSPFGAGGINPYVYCAGDPINHMDPSGHLSWQAWLGIGLGVAGLSLTVVTGGLAIAAAGGVAAALSSASTTALVIGGIGVVSDVTAIASGALEEANPELSSTLGWISMGTGLVGFGAALGVPIVRGVGNSLANLSKRVQLIQEVGLSGRGAPKAAKHLASTSASAPERILIGKKTTREIFGVDTIETRLGQATFRHAEHIIARHSAKTVSGQLGKGTIFPDAFTSANLRQASYKAIEQTKNWEHTVEHGINRYVTKQVVQEAGYEINLKVVTEKVLRKVSTDPYLNVITAFPIAPYRRL